MTVEKKLYLPSSRDPRLYMVAVLALFVTLAQLFLGFSQTGTQILTALLSCCILDFVLTAASTNRFVFPMSGLISGLSLCLLLNSGQRVLPFLLAAVIAISSKYILRFQGKHFFNPTNVALAIILLTNLGTINPGYQWGNGTTALWVALSMGGMILFRVKRLALIGWFILFFAISAVIRTFFFHESFALAFGVMTGAPFQLFTFFMLPDPRTTPNSTKGQVIFAFCTVFLDFILRVIRTPNTLFMSLFYVDVFVLLGAILGASYSVLTWPGMEKHTIDTESSVTNSPDLVLKATASTSSPK